VKNSANPQHLAQSATSRRSASNIWLSALTYWYLTGLLAALAFSFGIYLVRPAPHARAARDLLDAFTWQDGRWYKEIATKGYEYDQADRCNVAFFPAYPLLARAVMAATGVRAEAALLIVSNVSLFAALASLAFYVRDRYPQAPPDLTDYTVLIAALCPTGCFFRLTYSESTFLLLAVLAMYAMLRRSPLWATALIVGLATATRPVGIALLAPFAIHIVRRSRADEFTALSGSSRVKVADAHQPQAPARAHEADAEQNASEARPRQNQFRGSRAALTVARLALYMPVACWGFGAFTAYQYVAFGDPFATAKVQKNWGTPAAWRDKAVALATLEPLRSVYDPKSAAFWPRSDQHGIPWFSLQFVTPVLFVAATALIALGASLSLRNGVGGSLMSVRWLSIEETSFAALLLLIPYVTRAYEMGMGSMGRFVSVVFPVYLVLGQFVVRLPGALRATLLALAGFFLAACTALYAASYLIF
jgi:hypothetical protein